MSAAVGAGKVIFGSRLSRVVGAGGEQGADAGRAILRRHRILSRRTAVIEIFVNVFSASPLRGLVDLGYLLPVCTSRVALSPRCLRQTLAFTDVPD